MVIKTGKSFRDYVIEYGARIKNDQIHQTAIAFGLDEDKLRRIMELQVVSANINEYGRFEDLLSTVDRSKAKEYFENKEKTKLKEYRVNVKIDKFLRDFILRGGIDV